MSNLVLNSTTTADLDQFIRRPAHAAMIIGAEGMGKMAISRSIAYRLLGLANDAALERYPYFRIIAPTGQSISIEAIRELLGFTKLRIAEQQSKTKRLVIIDEAHSMTIEAQNALLKLLEEPPEGTLFLLNVSYVQGLLPTIRSRSQQLRIRQPNRADLEEYFTTQGKAAQQVHSAFLMSGGLPGLMHALLSDSESHPLLKAVEQARGLLRASTFERLALVDALAKQRPDCIRLLFVLQQMAHAAITQSSEKNGSTQSVAQWHKVLAAAYEAQNALQENAQAKLVLTNLMLNLS